MRRASPAWLISIAACSSAAPAPVAPAAPIAAAPADAALPDAAPDAGVPAAVAAAEPWIFGFHTADRSETWSLRYADGQAALDVASARGTLHYTGTARQGTAALALDVTTGSARVALSCKPTTRAIGAACNDAKARPIDVLDCYHPDFATPMPFGRAPGIEYVVDASCTGYRVMAESR